MELLNDLYVISLTHWDREWRFPFENTRMLLVEMMDALLDLLEKEPRFKCFHLDGQTVLLDDYCEVRKENFARLRKLTEEGRILVGPWYTLPDENLLSGESLVRNLMWGYRLGKKYGGYMRVGYSPTSWGQVSQMPQIFAGCGVNSAIFYRGITADQVPGHYYWWESPDGSRVFGIRLGDFARASFFHLVDRPVIFNKTRKEQTRRWEEGGKPVRLCGSGSVAPYYFCNPPEGWHPERIEEAFYDLEHTDLGRWETSFALAMECQDSIGAYWQTPLIIEEARKLVTNGKRILHKSLPEAVEEAMKQLESRELPVVRGEMQHPLRKGVLTDLFTDVHATRIPTKYMNRRAEYALQRRAEVVATFAWLLGGEYRRWFLDRAWAMLLQNHAHDSIGGCGMDEVDADVRYRFSQIEVISESVLTHSLRDVIRRVDTGMLDESEITVVAFNLLPRRGTFVVEAEVDVPEERDVSSIGISTMDGTPVASQVLSVENTLAVFNHPQELPLRCKCNRWKILFEAPDIPSLGYRTFRVVENPPQSEGGTIVRDGHVLENEYLSAEVNPDGTVNVLHKATGRLFKGLNLLEDRGEVGDPWVGMEPDENLVLTSEGIDATLSVKDDGVLSGTVEASFVMRLPACAEPDRKKRSDETVDVPVRVTYTLRRHEPFLRIGVEVENNAKDHVLRAVFPTDVNASVVHAEVPYDVVERDIELPDCTGWKEPHKPIHPHRAFVSISDGEGGIALLNRGLPQYESRDDERRTLALTLLRCHPNWNSLRLAYYNDQPGMQLIGTHRFEYAVMPHAGRWDEADVALWADWFNLGPVAVAAGPGPGDLPADAYTLVNIDARHTLLGALKKGEWDDGSFVVRLYNPSDKGDTARVSTPLPVEEVRVVNMLEEEIQQVVPLSRGDGGVSFEVDVPPHKILTLQCVLRAVPPV